MAGCSGICESRARALTDTRSGYGGGDLDPDLHRDDTVSVRGRSGPPATPLAAYAAPALKRRGLWRVALGLGLILALWLGWTVLVMAGRVLWDLVGHGDLDRALAGLSGLARGEDPLGIGFMLLTFLGIWPGVWAAVNLLHEQPFATLLSPERRQRWGEFAIGLAIGLGFALVSVLMAAALIGLPERSGLSAGVALAWFLPLAVLVFFQASAEELIFRGYVLQQLAARYRSPVAWAVVPSLAFGALHFGLELPGSAGALYIAVTVVTGIALAVLVWRTGALAAAMGLHTGINLTAILLVGTKGVVDGAQLWSFPAGDAELLLLADGAVALALLGFVLSPLCPLRAPEGRAA